MCDNSIKMYHSDKKTYISSQQYIFEKKPVGIQIGDVLNRLQIHVLTKMFATFSTEHLKYIDSNNYNVF